jgi:Uma2 family endonuclease
LSNDAGVITERGPDSVRGPDVAFYSYDRLPKGPAPHDYAQQPPELVIEVLSEFERWPSVLAKVAEYLGAGITLVLLLEDREQSAHVYRADAPTRILRSSEVLELPDILADFRARITDFFE